MRYSMLKTMLILPLLIAGTHPSTSAAIDPVEAYSYWNDGAVSGGSYLGVDTADITADRLGPLHLKEEQGVEVTMVDQDAPAGKAGIQEHDVILTVNGEVVQSVEELRRMIHEIPPGRTVSIGISRNGQAMTLKAQLARRKDFASWVQDYKFTMPALAAMPEVDIPASIVVVHSSARSGLMVENLSPQLSDYFGAKNGQGVLVRSVEKGSCAEKAGFRAGDVIVRVNDVAVNDTGDFGEALRNRKGNNVTVAIIRARKEQTIVLPLPEPRKTGFENMNLQEIGAQTREQMRGLQAQLAVIKPQVEMEIQRLKPELERQAKELCRQQEQIKEQVQKMERQAQEELQQEQKESIPDEDQPEGVPHHQADI